MLFQQAGTWAGNWQLQQGIDPPHQSAKNMTCIAAEVPGGKGLRSHFENLWAWMDNKLCTEYKCESIEEAFSLSSQVKSFS